MATANINQGDGSGNLLVGKVLVAHGSVQAQSANSAIRVLQPGSPIFMNDRIITGNEGMISILFNDAAGTQLDLGRMSDVVIDDDVFQEAGAEGPASFSEATAEVEQVQEALIAGEFDPTTDFEPTAAGPAAGGPASDGGGSSYVEFALTGEAVTPTSGAETTGVGLNFLDPQILQFEEAPVAPLADVPDEPPPPPPPPEDFAPSAGDYSSFVEERGLPEGTDGPDGSLTTTAGTFADLGIDFGGDGAGSVSFTHGAVTVPVVLDGNPATSTVLAGTYGTLTIFGNGTWQYEITDNTIVHSGINLVGAADFVPDNFTFTVFDSDGDSDGGTLTINVYDDGPVAAIEVEGIAATVEEDDMTGVPGGDQSLGNNDDGSTDFDEASSTSFGSVLPLFEVGADGPGDFGVSDDPAILSNLTTLYSKGEAVSYSSDGTTLTATAGGRDVFTLTVNNDGSWIFDLKDQLDHVDDGANNENYDLVTGDGSVGGIDFAPILTVIDADGDTAVGAGSGTFIVSIQDDVPVAVLEPRGILATVEEEDMTGVPGDDLSTGNNDDASVDQDEAGGAAGSLNQLFSVGSDEPFDYGITEDEEILGNLPSLYSNGQAVSYSSNGTTLTATADGREVFTLTVNNDGSWAFDLKDQLDHVDDGANDQNLSLVSGDGPINGIDLSTVLTITDYDGDTATGAAEGTFVVNVVDDVPIISLGEGRATGAVQEDALGNELVDGATDDTDSSLGNFENAGDTDTATLNLANLLDSPLDGADEPADVTYDITGIGVDGVKSDYTSNGAEVWYFKQDGKLVARAGNGGDDAGTVVFTFGVNSASGIATFNLDDQLDHDGLGDEETLSIGDLGSYVEATITDTDGDTDSVTFDGKIGITVENDVPIISLGEGRATGAVQEDALGNELVDGATDDTDSSLGNFENAGDTDTATMNLANLLDSPLDGADEPADVTYDITGIGVDGVKSDYTSNGAEVWYFKQDGKLVARAGNGGDDAGTVVFTFGVNSASGIATFNLDDQLDHDGLGDEETLSIGDLGSYVEATITDTDGDTDSVTFDGKIGITVENDVPIISLGEGRATGAVQEDALGNELVDGATDDTDSSLGNFENAGDTDTATMNLANLLDSPLDGADEPADVTYDITGIGVDGVKSDYTSNGAEVWYFKQDGKLVARAGNGGDDAGTVVFTFGVNSASGIATFNLDDQLDHDGLGDEETLSIGDLGSYVEATITDTDGDTDSVTFDGKIGITVENDVPIISLGEGRATGAVQEDALGNELVDGATDDTDSSLGNFENAGDTDTATMNLANLLDSPLDGADEPADVTYDITGIGVDGVKSDYTSNGAEVWYFKQDGKLVARAGNGGDDAGTVVFTFGVNSASGIATFNLDDQLDHDGLGDEETLSIGDLGSYVEATITDTDGDTDSVTFDGKIGITVENDVPIISLGEGRATGAVQEDALGNELVDGATDDTDSSLGNFENAGDTDTATMNLANLLDSPLDGADEPADVTYDITGIGVDGVKSDYTSNGAEVWYFKQDGKLVARAGNGGDDAGTVVFTFGVNSASGIATFNLDDQLDHDGLGDEETLSIGDLGSYVEATITDTDGDTDSVTFDGKIGITVENDVPIISLGEGRATGAVQEDALGNELVDGATDDTDSSLGNFENAGDTDTATMNLANLLDSPLDGADEPADVTYDITGIGVDGVKSDYTSNGAEVWYFKQDGKLVARAGNGGDDAGTVVFTFGVNSASGIATFNLDDQLDHDGLGDEETLSIGDLGSYVEATITDTDGDTDSVTFDGKIGITVENDVPIISLGEGRATGAVQEDALGNELVDGATDDTDSSLGNFENAGDTDTATMNLANLLDSPLDGADEPADVTYDITGIGVDGVKSDYTSNGAEVWYFKQDGKLVARAGNGGDDAGTVVFTFGVNSASGIATFNLDDQLDHDGLGDEETLSIGDLGSYVEATITDTDGDTDSVSFDGKIGITVENDVPVAVLQPAAIIGSVLEDGLSDASGDAGDMSEGIRESGESLTSDEDSGSSDPLDASNLSNLFVSGADEPITSYGITTDPSALATLDALYSHGEKISYSVSQGVSADTLTGTSTSGTVFTLTVNHDGSWAFDLDDQLDHVDNDLNDENKELRTGDDGLGNPTSSASAIDFSAVITATDADGDTTVGAAPGSFKVEVEDDIPEAASTTQIPGNMNLVLILDNSGSMYSESVSFGGGTVTRAAALEASVVALLTSLAGSADGSTYRVHLVEYNTDSASLGTYTITGGNLASANAAIAAIQGMAQPGGDDVYTNYEAGYQQALQWINSGGALTEADVTGSLVNEVVFISDGDPNRWNDPDMGQPGGPDADGSGGGSSDFALEQVTGSDGSNEITAIGAWADNVRAIGINVSGDQDDRLDTLDLTSDAFNITSGDQLLAILPELIKVPLPIISATVEEDDLTVDGDALTDPDNSTGINEDGSTNADETAGSTVSTDATNLANLFVSGADEELSYGMSTNVSGLPNLYSNGVALAYNVVGNTLTGSAGGNTIFTFTVNADGSWSFDLDGQLDHVAGDGENFDLLSGNGTDKVEGIDLSTVIVAVDADGDEVQANAGSFVMSVQDDVPDIGTPQDSLLAIQQGNSLTASLDIEGSGADDPHSISLGLTEGALVQTIGGATMTSGGKTLFWHANDAEGTSWSAVTHTSGGAPLATSFTVSVDEASGTYTVEQSGILDGASSTKIITFDANGAMGGGNTYEAVFGAGGTEVENGDITTYSNSVFIWAKASTDLVSPFGWNGVTDTWVDDTTTVNYSSSGIGVGDGAMIDGTTFAGSRNSEILSLKFFSELEVDYGGSNQEDVRVNEGNSQVLNLTGVKLVLDHLGHDETAYYTLWNDGVQVSQTYSITGLDNGTGSSADNKDDLLTITNSQLNAGETVFDEVRLESGTGGSNAYRVQSAEVTIFQPGVDETINIPVLVEDADGDVVTDSFSVTFDGQGNLDATVADAADGDDSVNGMVIVGSSGDNTIIGTDYDDTIDGKGGNDNITGGAGDDNIEGGAGSDILVGNIGDDNLYGDAGNDILSGGDGNDQLIGGTGTDNLSGGANDDTLVGDNVNFSTPGDPVVVEDAAPDVISGGSGSDVAGNQSGTPANTDTITTTESIVLDIDTLVPPPEDTV